jgi:fructose-bisphosphate aldolase class I
MQELKKTMQQIVERGRGILAADESFNTIGKRFASIQVENTEENRKAYRELLFKTKNLGDFVSAVILFEETLMQKSSDGRPFPELLESLGILPGIKVDKGLVPLLSLITHDEEKVTQGLDGLSERLVEYKRFGARFAKWRAVFDIDGHRPSTLAIKTNADLLARYAAICQAQGIVPIVEPELLMDGMHTIEQCERATEHVLHSVFHALHRHHVQLELMILKPSMVISGKECSKQASSDEIAQATIRILLRTVPAAVPTINFLSGGQSPEFATANLNAMNANYPNLPWNLSFSYGRALQEPALTAWLGRPENVLKAQEALYKRAKLNSLACHGKYHTDME